MPRPLAPTPSFRLVGYVLPVSPRGLQDDVDPVPPGGNLGGSLVGIAVVSEAAVSAHRGPENTSAKWRYSPPLSVTPVLASSAEVSSFGCARRLGLCALAPARPDEGGARGESGVAREGVAVIDGPERPGVHQVDGPQGPSDAGDDTV